MLSLGLFFCGGNRRQNRDANREPVVGVTGIVVVSLDRS